MDLGHHGRVLRVLLHGVDLRDHGDGIGLFWVHPAWQQAGIDQKNLFMLHFFPSLHEQRKVEKPEDIIPGESPVGSLGR